MSYDILIDILLEEHLKYIYIIHIIIGMTPMPIIIMDVNCIVCTNIFMSQNIFSILSYQF